jgi:hypothetical protein
MKVSLEHLTKDLQKLVEIERNRRPFDPRPGFPRQLYLDKIKVSKEVAEYLVRRKEYSNKTRYISVGVY